MKNRVLVVLVALSLLLTACLGGDSGSGFSHSGAAATLTKVGLGLVHGNYFLGSCLSSGWGEWSCSEHYGPSSKSSAVQKVCNDQNNSGGISSLYSQSVCDQSQATYICDATQVGFRIRKFFGAGYSLGRAKADCDQLGGLLH